MSLRMGGKLIKLGIRQRDRSLRYKKQAGIRQVEVVAGRARLYVISYGCSDMRQSLVLDFKYHYSDPTCETFCLHLVLKAPTEQSRSRIMLVI